MKRIAIYLAVLLISVNILYPQPPQGRTFGFGLILGEPLGATAKIWTSRTNAIALAIGGSYYGSPRIGADYLWHFNAFNTPVVNLYAGPGIVLGFGEYRSGWWYKKDKFYYPDENRSLGVAVRGVMGINVVPRNTPIEIFLEAAPLISISPRSFSAFDLALGIRFYP